MVNKYYIINLKLININIIKYIIYYLYRGDKYYVGLNGI